MATRSIKASAWSAIDVATRQVLQIAVMLVLARILTPTEFGTVALLSILAGLASVLADGGLSMALIQRQDITPQDESTAFWLNVGAGTFAAVALAACSPIVASFYGLDILQPLTLLLALNVVFGALTAVPTALMIKRLRFRRMWLGTLIANVLGGAVAIALAVTGNGVWALAAQAVTTGALTAAMIWILAGWRPQFAFSSPSARSLLSYGGFVLATGLMEVAYTRLYTVLLGRFHTIRQVGLYSRADQTQQLPGLFVALTFSRVSLAILSASSTDTAYLRERTRRAVRLLSLAMVPTMVTLAAAAEPIFITLYGPQWSQAAAVFAVLCVGGTLLPLHIVNFQVLLAQGHARLSFNVEVIKKVIGVSLIVVGSFFGLMGIAWSQVAYSVMAFFVNTHYTGRLLRYGAAAQLRDVSTTFVTAIPGGILSWLIVTFWAAPAPVEAACAVVVSMSVFLASAHLLGLEALKELREQVTYRP